MKQKFLILLWLALAGHGFGQQAQPKNITSTQCAQISADHVSTVGIQVVGSWTGTLQPEVAIQGQAPAATQVTPAGSSTPQSTITANGVYTVNVAAMSTFLVCGATVSAGTAVVYMNASQLSAGGGGGGGGGSGTVSGTTGNLGGFSASTTIGNAPATFSGNNINVSPSGTSITSDTSAGVFVDGIRFPKLCNAMNYAAQNSTHRSRVYDFNQYEAWDKDPFNDATCGAGYAGASVWLGSGNFIQGTGGTVHLPNGLEFYLTGRGGEAQTSTTVGCGTATPTACIGTLIIAYTTSAPFTGGNALTCSGCTLFPVNIPVFDYATASAFGTIFKGPGTISCAGVSGSIGLENDFAQETSWAQDLTIVGCQSRGLKVAGSHAQNFFFDSIEVLSGSLTGNSVGTPSTFSCFEINVNAPNRRFGNSTCNPQGSATTGPINVAVLIKSTRGGQFHNFHIQNANYMFVVDGSSDVLITSNDTSDTSIDASTPVAVVYFCGSGSASPCSTGVGSSRGIVMGFDRIAPNVTTNAIIDDTANGGSGRTIAYANWRGSYMQSSPDFGSALLPINGGSGLISPTAHSLLVGEGASNFALVTSPAVNGYYGCGFNVTGSAAVDPTCSLQGVPNNPQTGTTYTMLASDRAGRVSFSNASSIAVTLPQAGTTGFTNNYTFLACAIGAGTATITPTTSTISYTTGSAYTSGASSMALTTGQCAYVYSDDTNYFAVQIAGGSSGLTIAPLIGTWMCSDWSGTDFTPITGTLNGTAFNGCTGTEANAQGVSGQAGHMTAMYAHLSANVPSTKSLAITIRVAGADTALTCTMAAASPTCNVTGQSVAVSAGALLAVKVVGTATFGLSNAILTVGTTMGN